MRPLCFIGFFLAFGLLAGCEYQLDSEHFRHLQMPDTAATIHMELLPLDTSLVMNTPVILSFDLNTYDFELYYVQVFLDDESIYQGEQAADSFYFDPGAYEKGFRTLTLVVTTGTNTGSLSEMVGYEGLVFMRQWEIYTYGCCPATVSITSVSVDDGLLKLEWDTTAQIGFEAYNVYVLYQDTGINTAFHLVARFTDPAVNSCHDTSYIGGTADYWVEVRARNQGSGGPVTRVSYDAPAIDTLWQKGDSAMVSWSRTLFYRAIRRYLISTEAYNNHSVAWSTNDVNDTTCMIRNIRFGSPQPYTLWIELVKGYGSTTWSAYKPAVGLGMGDRIPSHIRTAGVMTASRIYLQPSLLRVSRFNFPRMDLLNGFQVISQSGWTVTPDDRFLFIAAGDVIRKHDPATLALLGQYDAEEIGLSALRNSSVRGTALVESDGTLGLFDFVNDAFIFAGRNSSLAGAVLSPDGRYAFTKRPLAGGSEVIVSRVTADSLKVLWSLPEGSYNHAAWVADTMALLIVITGDEEQQFSSGPDNHVDIYGAGDGIAQYSFSAVRGFTAGMDLQAGLFGMWNYYYGTTMRYKFFMYDLFTGLLLKEFFLSPDADALKIYRSCLLDAEGYSLDLNEMR